MIRCHDIEHALAESLPSAVTIRAAAIDQAWPELPAVEARLVVRAVPVRRAEFAAGRHLARDALATLGHAVTALPATRNAGPAWPEGVAGSISHADGLVVVVVSEKTMVDALGVDVENAEQQLESAAWPAVFSPNESAVLANPSQALADFSAKEAVYKAIAPLGGSHLRFTDLVIERTAPAGFMARIAHARIASGPAGLVGRQIRCAGRLIHVAYRRP